MEIQIVMSYIALAILIIVGFITTHTLAHRQQEITIEEQEIIHGESNCLIGKETRFEQRIQELESKK